MTDYTKQIENYLEMEKEMLEKLWASGQAPWKVWKD